MSPLPYGWKLVRLTDVAETALGKMLDRGRPKGLPQVPYVRNVNVQWGRIDIRDLRTMELDDSERERFAVRAGDLLACEGGEVGRAGIWRGGKEFIAYQKAVHRIRTKGDLELTYLRYLLELYSANGTLHRFSTGSTIAHLPQEKLRALPVPLPSLAEQRRIVDVLEDHLSRLDAAETSLAHALRRQEVFRAANLQAMSMGPPVRLGELATDSSYGTSTKCGYSGSGTPVVRIPNLVAGRLDLRDEKRALDTSIDLARLMLRAGDLLIVRTNGSRDLIGRAAVVQSGIVAAFASYLIRFRINPHRSRPHWVRLMLETPKVRRTLESLAASSAGQYNLGLGKLNAVEIPCPSLQEQDRLLTVAEEAEWTMGQLLTAVYDAQNRSRALRRALLDAAFSGRLTGYASDLDRAEEMAGV